MIIIEDEEYQRHSFSDALTLGLRHAKEQMDRVLVLPVEYPAFANETLEQLLTCEHAAVPVYQEQMGWPRSDPGITYSLGEMARNIQ